MRELGLEIRVARTARGWSQTFLADEAGVSRPSIARIEAGEDVNTATLVKVAQTLDYALTVVRPIAEK
ncbi:helix-turn-helix transcriptional regulator [Glutamicibacter arilaitensis]|uniref:helix-turn-helix transcriptional regulator n=1 Tax=Glutamicibacter arilaitensis TaxID=256701 RepID=UPI003FD59F9C